VLDIFGFEVLNKNSLEQFLINLANEQLNDYFQNHMYAEQTALLESESLLDTESTKEFHDHLSIICNEQQHRLQTLRKVILEQSLCEVSQKPYGNDDEFMETVTELAAGNDILDPKGNDGFEVTHFAANVNYTAAAFVEKNKFRLYDNLRKLIESCSEVFLHKLVAGEVASDKTAQLSERFTTSLDELLQLLSVSMPRFIRCIKSNTGKRPWEFEPSLIHRQLRYASILQTVRICSTGYPEQLTFDFFYYRCKPLFADAEEIAKFEGCFPQYFKPEGPDKNTPVDVWKEGAGVVLELCMERLGQWMSKSVRIGAGTVMLREDASQVLDNERRRLEHIAEKRTEASKRKVARSHSATKVMNKMCALM